MGVEDRDLAEPALRLPYLRQLAEAEMSPQALRRWKRIAADPDAEIRSTALKLLADKAPEEAVDLIVETIEALIAEIQALVDGARPQQVVQMERPVDVQLMYWTVSPEDGQRLEYHDDIYQLDAAALAALNAPPRPSPFHG